MQVECSAVALFSLAGTLSLGLTALLTDATLTRSRGRVRTILVWLCALAAHYLLCLASYSLNATDDSVNLLGLMGIAALAAWLLYQEAPAARVFTAIMAALISNVMTFFFCGTTLSFLDNAPNPYNTRTLLIFNGIKLFWFAVLFLVYRRLVRRTVAEVISVLGARMKRYVPIPVFTFVAFALINRITNSLGVMPAIPETRVVFIFFYLIVCSIFVVLYWEIFSTALWSSRAQKTEAELNVASSIQRDMLPNIFPAFPERPEFDIYATMQPAKEVGGDFYDFFLVDEDHLALVIADVSGKGVPAALFMVIAKTLLKNCAQTGVSPKAVLETVNNQLCENNQAEMFVTVWLGILEISTGRLTAANAGHEYPALKRSDGPYELVQDKHGFVLAGMEGSRYREYELTLAPGDTLYVYTDGVAEATDAHDALFGTGRMLASLNRHADALPEALLPQVKADIDAFVGQAPQFDDITMLGLRYRGPAREGSEQA